MVDRAPRLWPALRLHCPYCGQSSLRDGGSFLVSGFLLGGVLLLVFPDLDVMFIAGGSGIYMLVCGILFWPWSMALWMVIEHRLHPLRPEDRLSEPPS